MLWVLCSLIIIIVGFGVYLRCSYSKLKSDFIRETKQAQLAEETYLDKLSEDKMKDLPDVVKRFYRVTGYMDKPLMGHLQFYCEQADFVMNKGDELIKIDYTEEVFSKKTRLAFIDSQVHGIPFQGLDRFEIGRGSMTGVLAKMITLFHSTGKELDQAAFVTWFSEAIFLPKAILSEPIQWSNETEQAITATLIKDGQHISVTYHFDEEGYLTKVETNDRYLTKKDNTYSLVPWYMTFGNYEKINDVKLPRAIKAVWKLASEDFTYFDSHRAKYTFY